MTQGFNSQQEEIFSPHCGIQTHSGDHPASYSLGISISSSGGKELSLEAVHATPPSSEFN
jgi:hypothetical protein